MTTVYRFKPWARLAGDPQQVGEAIEAIRETTGTVGPREIVEAARPAESVLHRYFDWDNDTAAEAYREQQARHLLRSVTVVQAEGIDVKAPVRAFVALRAAAQDAAEDAGEESAGSYTSISAAVRVVRYREQMMRDALRDLDAYRMKYQLLSDISGWGSALQKAREELQRMIDAAQQEAA